MVAQTHDLVQDIITDCSVVASLCAVTARTERGHSNILSTCFYPFDKAHDRPSVSPNGKYVFRFHFNGCYRRIFIDDRLPTTSSPRSLHVIDRKDSAVYWPALIEKAYLKVRGGYDFPGSNSGTDLWVLTGWIPEQVFIQTADMDRVAFWRRILKAFAYGDVLITLGTGKLSEKEERGMGLVGEHDYAVVDVDETRHQPVFLIKNPWANGRVWKGHLSFVDQKPSMIQNFSDMKIHEDRRPKHSHEPLSPGMFWMPLNDIYQSFESVYLNWNPGLFSYREDVHFSWDLCKLDSPEGFLGSNPQYVVKSAAAGIVWIVLTRHFKHIERSERADDYGQHLSSMPQEGFVSLYAFLSSGHRIQISDKTIAHSPYVDSPNALLKVEAQPGQSFTIALSEQAFPRRIESFTLSAFSSAPVEVVSARDVYEHENLQRGVWTIWTSGGNASGPDYRINPQFCLIVAEQADILLFLQNAKECWPVNVNLVWAKGRQIQSVTTRDIVGGSGEYRKGFAIAEIKGVPAGTYTVVCSTFEKGQLGDFELRVGSTNPCQIKPVTTASAGRFMTSVKPAILAPGEDHWIAPLYSQRLNRLSVSAKSQGDALAPDRPYCSPLKISIEVGQGPMKQVIGVSGEDEFIDARHQGVSTPDTDILPSMSSRGLWLSLERLGCSGIPSDERIDVQILSDAPCEVGRWTRGPEG